MRVVRQGAVTVDVGECALCNDLFSEEAVLGEDPNAARASGLHLFGDRRGVK